MSTTKFLIAGFGGQGVLFSGKALAYTGLFLDKEVSWLPSYGPEMRGGTANCSVTVSDESIGSPIVTEPDILVAMNQPSFDKYCRAVSTNGIIIYDSSLVKTEFKTERGIMTFAIPASQLSKDEGLSGLTNMIILGKAIKESGVFTILQLIDAVRKIVPSSKAKLLEGNIKAIELGNSY